MTENPYLCFILHWQWSLLIFDLWSRNSAWLPWCVHLSHFHNLTSKSHCSFWLSDLLRCNHCYRTFRTDVAIRHVETCSRKTLLNHGEAPNALGRAVATGISTNQLRSRQVSMNFFRSKLCLVHIWQLVISIEIDVQTDFISRSHSWAWQLSL